MTESSVNNLNGVPNFGHGFPEVEPNGEVMSVEETSHEEETSQADVPADESQEEEVNG